MKIPRKTTMAKSPGQSQEGGMPAYQLSLPVLLVLFLFFMIFGGGLTYLATRAAAPASATPTEGGLVMITDTPPVDTPVPTDTLIPTVTNTPEPQPTLPPIEYIVQSGDTCQAIAGAFNISTTALITTNGLSVNCYLVEGQRLLVPQPTPLPTTDAIATQSAKQTAAACPVEYVTVQSGDTIEVISQYTRVPVEEILSYNGKTSNLLFAGEILAIPTCKQTSDFDGATYTPSPAPTYQAAEPIQPSKGSYFQSGEEIILQWTAPAELRQNEYFLLTITDTTDGGSLVLEETLKETRYILPQEYQPEGSTPHIYAWGVSVVAVIGEDAAGNPILRVTAADSQVLYFAWESK
ncbi:MAG: LysM peptidoglycan-binding domain-containing protein [Anaerolineales bacterium]|nr:LysM peptidoglycan-binding domain-containing protein [Anaerolineales bacterium]